MSNGSATTITVNTGLFAAGDIVTIINLGAGVCTITAGTATVTTSGSLALAQNQGGVLRFTSASAAIFFQFATPASGDIEGVTAGTGISGGGTSGTVTITNSMATEIDAKGDLIVGTGADAFARLAVGTNGHTLVADSAETTGLKWAAASSGAMTKITTATFSASGAADIDSVFTSSYNNYLVVMNYMFANVAALDLELQFKYGATVSTSGYYCGNYEVTAAGGAGAASTNNAAQIRVSNATGSTGSRGGGFFYVRTVGGSSAQLQISGQYYVASATSAYTFSADMGSAQSWSGMRFKASGGDLSGEITVFGLEK
jgi:hypothetical protein